LALELEITGIEHSFVNGDPGRIRQILNNLVGNAIKFTNNGKIVIRACLQKRVDNKLMLTCSVTDTGIGIPDEKFDCLFEVFSQVDASTTRQYGGTGLGLSIAKQMCELMGGTISVTSEEGKGSCFEFNILLKASQQAKPLITNNILADKPSEQIQGDAAKPTLEADISTLDEQVSNLQYPSNTRILLVDDNQINLLVAQGILEGLGVNPDIINAAANGEEALQLLKTSTTVMPYTLIFMDCQMPVMDGYEASTQIRAGAAGEANKSIPIIAMTANAMKGDEEKCLKAGMSDYIAKPVDPGILLSKLKSWL